MTHSHADERALPVWQPEGRTWLSHGNYLAGYGSDGALRPEEAAPVAVGRCIEPRTQPGGPPEGPRPRARPRRRPHLGHDRTRRTPVASSQTSQAANPRNPTKISAEPSAIARLPTPAASSRLPPTRPTRPSRRCQAGASPLACAARAAPMKVV